MGNIEPGLEKMDPLARRFWLQIKRDQEVGKIPSGGESLESRTLLAVLQYKCGMRTERS